MLLLVGKSHSMLNLSILRISWSCPPSAGIKGVHCTPHKNFLRIEIFY